MNAKDLLEKIGESLGSAATVKSVFGEPIQMEGKTVVPVAKIAYGFGAGGGSRPNGGQHGDPNGCAEGGGGGGGVRAFPAGALEITPQGTRFITYPDWRLAATIFSAGMMFGAMIRRRRS